MAAGARGFARNPPPERAEGCCSFGAHFAEDDRERVERAAAKLRDNEWQFAQLGRKSGIVASHGSALRTRIVQDACIFLNRPGFEGGTGCALHLLAERLGVHTADTKPDICWQLPLRRVDEEEDDGSITSVVTKFDRSAWGDAGEDFAWWCTDTGEAFSARKRVYQTLETELRRMCGDSLYEGLTTYLDRVPPSQHAPRDPVPGDRAHPIGTR